MRLKYFIIIIFLAANTYGCTAKSAHKEFDFSSFKIDPQSQFVCNDGKLFLYQANCSGFNYCTISKYIVDTTNKKIIPIDSIEIENGYLQSFVVDAKNKLYCKIFPRSANGQYPNEKDWKIKMNKIEFDFWKDESSYVLYYIIDGDKMIHNPSDVIINNEKQNYIGGMENKRLVLDDGVILYNEFIANCGYMSKLDGLKVCDSNPNSFVLYHLYYNNNRDKKVFTINDAMLSNISSSKYTFNNLNLIAENDTIIIISLQGTLKDRVPEYSGFDEGILEVFSINKKNGKVEKLFYFDHLTPFPEIRQTNELKSVIMPSAIIQGRLVESTLYFYQKAIRGSEILGVDTSFNSDVLISFSLESKQIMTKSIHRQDERYININALKPEELKWLADNEQNRQIPSHIQKHFFTNSTSDQFFLLKNGYTIFLMQKNYGQQLAESDYYIKTIF